jgi:signal transduction histidine kinase/DNA-binding response OmpR family regulator
VHDPGSGFAWLDDGGAMGALTRAFDWRSTPLGAPETWSPTLRTMVRFLLANRFPQVLWWGSQYIQFYNDAYRDIPGTKHPKALGQPAAECWAEIWPIIGPLIDTPFSGGPATWDEDICLELDRHGFLEETHFTIAYSPVPDDTAPGGIGGVLATVHEITGKVIGERRIGTLRDLGAHVGHAKDADEACAIVTGVLAEHPRDVPFAMLYLIDRAAGLARLAGATAGLHGAIAPACLDLQHAGARSAWPFAEALATDGLVVVEGIQERFPGEVPAGPWSDAPTQAVVVPIPSTTPRRPAGVMVAGISARLRMDEHYRDFFELLRTQVATAIASARAYEEARQQAEALAEIDRAKTAFFSNVSHEFRTPLTLLIGPLEDGLADRSDPLPAAHRTRHTIAHRNALRLLRLVNTLLDFSRLEAGRVEAVFEPTDLAELTSDLVSNFRSACERAGIRLVVDCAPLSHLVHVDRDMWEKIVLNFLSNALKFTLDGEIAVTLRASDHYAELSVRDTGTGIAPDDLPRVFERFYRVRGARGRTHEGTGIGLALVQELVQLHGGTVRVESTFGKGSTFSAAIPFGTAHLPAARIGSSRTLASTAAGARPYVEEALQWLPTGEIAKRGEDAPPGDGSAVPASAPAIPGRPPSHVLVVDDNADMRRYVAHLLSRRSRVTTVPDGEAAWEAIQRERPDLILSDVMMPRLDGVGLLERVRSHEATANIPVLLLSARAGEESRVEGLAHGADDYVVKPFSARELIARVDAHLLMAGARRDADAALRASEERLRIATSVARVGSFDWNLQTGASIWTPELEAMHGLSPGSFGRTHPSWATLVHPDDRAGALALVDRAVATGEPVEGEWRVVWPDGQVRWVGGRCQCLYDAGGRPLRLIGANFDITARKAAEARQAFVLQLNDALRVLDDPVAIQTTAARLLGAHLGVNRCLYFEIDGPDAVVRGAYCRGVEPFPARVPYDVSGAALAERYRRGEAVAVDDVATDPRLRPEERERALRAQVGAFAGVFPMKGGRLVAAFSVHSVTPRHWSAADTALIHDVASRTWDAVERAQAEARLREANARKDEFLAMLAHELRNPLAPIRTGLELIRLGGDAPETVARVRQMLERQVGHMVRLIDDLLDVSRITSGKIRLQREPAPLAELIQSALDANQSAMHAKALDVRVDQPAAPCMVDGDPTRLVQVLSNLLHNAAKFTPRSGWVRISVTPSASEREVAVAVRDSGVGIPADLLPHVFELFTQGHQASSEPGLGIGLALAHRLVQLHGGRIEARSEGVDQGSEFVVHLPLADEAAAAPGREALVPAAQGARRVLVVDDNRDAADALALLLETLGAETRVAYSGDGALAALDQYDAELVLLDLAMPGLDGFETCRRMRGRDGGRAVIVALTGYGRDRDKDDAERAGFDAHLTKPVDARALSAVLEHVAGVR